MSKHAQLDAIRRVHSASIQGYIAAAEAKHPEAWATPLADGKWSPGLVTEHLIGAYEAVLKEVRTGSGIRVVTGWLMRNILRQSILRYIMASRKLPPGAKAPREALPTGILGSREERLAALAALAADLENEIAQRVDDPTLVLTHHFFGSVDPIRGLDFLAIHNEHHTRQLL